MRGPNDREKCGCSGAQEGDFFGVHKKNVMVNKIFPRPRPNWPKLTFGIRTQVGKIWLGKSSGAAREVFSPCIARAESASKRTAIPVMAASLTRLVARSLAETQDRAADLEHGSLGFSPS